MADAKVGPGSGRTAELQRQMDEIGDRFAKRLLTELTVMRDTLADVRAGDAAGLKDLEISAHRIHGSSAMFGFAALSQQAGALERLVARECVGGTANLAAIEAQLALLDSEARALAGRHGLAS